MKIQWQTRRSLVMALLMAAFAAQPVLADGKLNVVAATTDLGSLVSEVGGDRVSVTAIARGYQDPHFVEAKPSFLLNLRRADLVVVVGLELEIGWLPPLITQSGNPKIQPAAPGYFDASRFAEILEIPTAQVSRAMGDVHPQGNPHYWLDPKNGLRVATGLAQKLTQMSPGNAAYFQQRLEDFRRRLTDAERRWDDAMKPYRGRKVVTYHQSWPNFVKRFGLQVVDYVEPRPGIPPSPAHVVELIALMKRQGVKLILVEPYFDLKTPQSVARETGGQVVVLMPSVGGDKDTGDYIKLFDYDVNLLVRAFQQAK
ncbi:MAG: zinc ABC transporter substrate-binding protein [Geothrix sp.]|uniref:metal ABC transporter substrate-binding protein n=1 Tax=Geothrix sp. TaxID=1962974 RepID=UPI0017D4FA06|nr:metal ABC transporter substrate-binding protein [Geothrix sp.]NWJ42219.1 zinc ABC transporter substrate-binding protein [Geothrix sp.]WIL19818.1 MAG: metal ABC transporter substrate-binding protein [Geothrix sp.]